MAALSEYLIKYDPYADALYIRVREGRIMKSDEIASEKEIMEALC